MKLSFFLAPAYAALVFAYPNIVWWTWILALGMLGVYVCLLAVWVSVMALDEIQVHWRIFQSNRRKKSVTCSDQTCKLDFIK